MGNVIVVQALIFRQEWNMFFELISADNDKRKRFMNKYLSLSRASQKIEVSKLLVDYFPSGDVPDIYKKFFEKAFDIGNPLRNFLDAGAAKILSKIEKMENYRRASDIVSMKGYYQLKIKYDTKEIQRDSLEQPTARHLVMSVRVSIDAPEETLSQIEKVIYYPQPPDLFPPPYAATDYVSNFSCGWRVWGTFNLKAKVYMKNGQIREIEQYIDF